MKLKSNTLMVKELIKDLTNTPYEIGMAVLRERLVKIAEITERDIQNNPEAWRNPMIEPGMYLDFCYRVQKIIGFKK